MKSLVCAATLVLVVLSPRALWSQSAVPAATTYDVVVYGGTSGGIAAAIQVARMGKSVVLVEPSQHLGGLTSGGLGATDIGNKAAIGGISREFYQRIKRHYDRDDAWRWQRREQYRGNRGSDRLGEDAMWTFEPHVAEKVFADMLHQAKVEVLREQRIDLKRGVEKDGARIVAIVTESGRRLAGRQFIDGTYEGDLLAATGVSYTVGREANATYGETLNGVQVAHARSHQFIKPVDPYVKPGDKSSGLIFGVGADGPGTDGAKDHRVQAYNLRICATDVPANRLAWPKPADYDESRYELLLRNIEAGDLRIPWNPVRMPNGKTDSNNNYAVSTDFIGFSYDWPEGDYAARERIVREHVSYTAGLFWTLANHPRVHPKLREYFQRWGLSKDEFADSGHWPHQLYVREARRMVSDYVMTQHDCQGRRRCDDPVGLAAYTMDSHNVQRYVDAKGHVRNEGDVQVGGFPPYPISYLSIAPKQAECTNLLVPVCLSASHIAFGSIRMEPVFMVLGQSSATAACQAIDQDVAVQKIDYSKLQKRLLDDKQVLEWSGSAGGASGVDPKKLSGIVVDDAQAKATGPWTASFSVPGYVGSGYRHDNNEGQGERSMQFTTTLPKAGRYEVRVAYVPHENRATNVPVTIRHAGGESVVQVNQRKKPTSEGRFVSLGKYGFDQGEAIVTIANTKTNGYVIADAVQWLSVEQ